MRSYASRRQFLALFAFLLSLGFILTNGFSGRIFAEDDDYFEQIEPIGDVLSEVVRNYVRDPDMDKVVEGAIDGMMRSLDRNSSFITADQLQSMQEETEGEFEGIGVTIRAGAEGFIEVAYPLPNAPAALAGVRAGDLIVAIDGVSAEGMEINEVQRRIKGPRGQAVKITVLRPTDTEGEFETMEFDIKRGTIPLESIDEARVMDNGITYIRIHDFKKNTADDLRNKLQEFQKEGMKSLILDMRWNPGGLLSASREVSELFLSKGSLVTTTRGRKIGEDAYREDMELKTQKEPVVPETLPIIVLVSQNTASSSEIVTGALQFHQRAIVVGEKTYGKGSVQTIIPLRRPRGSALRLTTALYYTPAEVTIDGTGILPDVEVTMSLDEQRALLKQMLGSYAEDISRRHQQNHGSVTGNQSGENGDEIVQDRVLQEAVRILRESTVFTELLQKYHKDVSETQVAVAGDHSEAEAAGVAQ